MSAQELIDAERAKQVAKGFTAEHDDSHDLGELTDAAICYAAIALGQVEGEHEQEELVEAIPQNYIWPFEIDSWHPTECPVENLTKAAALIRAEIERLQRAKAAYQHEINERDRISSLHGRTGKDPS